MTGEKAAFLDRDGVINVDRGYVHRVADFEFLPGVLEACTRFVSAGYRLIVITNQAGIARGYYGHAEFEALTAWMTKCFHEAGAPIAAVYYCPHHPAGSVPELRRACDCRKPEPGLLLRARREFDLSMADSFIVGDKPSDIEAGIRAGVGQRFLVRSANAEGDAAGGAVVVSGLPEVAELLAQGYPDPGHPNPG